ncbi:hypothetical protein AJ79_08896 [Helicocarpus griseus UAMH5409]|uniref:Uncharacterized protein n=1 Tax=Helicocarpus griseus UAMH5409 TaxID=1447875 RepID=A0A2B7WP50_9EURO|nr:hypothetical protein AJ79_08896 [Helicocarpus griseus UAMH5409]
MRCTPSVYNDVYVEFWALVEFPMPGLVDLYFCLEYHYATPKECEKIFFGSRWPNWVLPILNVRGLRTFELSIDMQSYFERSTPMYIPVPPLLLLQAAELAEDIKCVMLSKVANDPGELDVSSSLLSQAAKQEHKAKLLTWLLRRYQLVTPASVEFEKQKSSLSYGFLTDELYRPDLIEAHRSVKPRRDRMDGQLYVKNAIQWIIQKGESYPKSVAIPIDIKRPLRVPSETKFSLYSSTRNMKSHYPASHEENEGATLAVQTHLHPEPKEGNHHYYRYRYQIFLLLYRGEMHIEAARSRGAPNSVIEPCPLISELVKPAEWNFRNFCANKYDQYNNQAT